MFTSRAVASLRPLARTQTVSLVKTTMVRVPAMAPAGARILSTSSPKQQQQEVTVAPLIQQRKNRPLTPHLTIYQPQLTWYMSAFHRFTGGALATGFYAGAIAYTVAPMVGLGFDAAAITSVIATVPVAAKIGAKFIIAYPFTFHVFNGVRHLVWDTTRALSLKGVYQTGYTVLGLSAVSAAALALV